VLLFRYDNAKHKPTLAFSEHKHCAEDIIFAPAPNLQDVVQDSINFRHHVFINFFLKCLLHFVS